MIYKPLTKQQLRKATEATQAIIKSGKGKSTGRVTNATDKPRSFRDEAYENSVGVVYTPNGSLCYSMRSYQNEALQC